MHLTNYTTAEAAGELNQTRAVILKIMTITQQQDYEGPQRKNWKVVVMHGHCITI